jgi:hypothetical protein
MLGFIDNRKVIEENNLQQDALNIFCINDLEKTLRSGNKK